MEVHIVVKGDTLWKIARQYGIPFEDLKRVNAHLANPDYIVPGMKIFLPKRQHNAESPEKGKGPVTPLPPKGTKPSPPIPVPKPPTSKPSTPKPPTPIPIPPAPAPRPPAPPSKPTLPKPVPPPAVLPTVPAPIPLPTPTPTPTPTPMPTPMPMPMPTPMPMHPPQTFAHPMIGIPCGWMPIFDADCFPFMHSGQIQAMPRPEPPMHHAPLPMPLPSTQFPMYEQESPIFSGQGHATAPLEIPMVEGWQLLESPDFMFEETAEMVVQPSAEYSPEFMYEESTEFDLQPSAPCPPGPGYVPQAISPAVQGQWNPGQFGYPAMPQPGYHQGCGCGCEGQQHQQRHHQQMMIPLFYGHPCNCPSCMQQATPYSGMPPNQGANWYGAY